MREKPRDKERLQHIIDAIDSIEKFTKGISYKDFLNNKMMQFALIKNLEIIGEAAYCTTKDLRKKFPYINWKMIVDFRHILVHDYYRIEIDVIWVTIQNDIPELKKNILKITQEIAKEG